MRRLKVILTTYNQHGNFSLAFGYLIAYARKDPALAKNVDFQIMDFCVDCHDVNQALYFFARNKPDVVGLSVFCWNADKASDLARLTKQVLPATVVVAGGPEVGPIAEEWLRDNPGTDIVVQGEGEATFSELLKHYAAGKGSLGDITGISYRHGDDIVRNPDRPLIEDLDEIPSPYLSGVLVPRDMATYLETYRGCPYRCGYCYEGKNYPRLRHFSKERTAEEIEFVMGRQDIKTFSFIDPVFNLTADKLADLAEMLSSANQHGAGLHTVEVMTELVTKETVAVLRKAGVRSVETGPQTANRETLVGVGRYFDRKKFARGVELLKQGGIKVLCDLMIGLPGDNLFKFARSVDFVFSLRPSTVVMSTLHVLPGTDLWENSGRFGLEFDRRAPHYVLCADGFPYEEVRKAEILAESLRREYSARS